MAAVAVVDEGARSRAKRAATAPFLGDLTVQDLAAADAQAPSGEAPSAAAAVAAAVVAPAVSEAAQGLPPWIVENQKASLAGWEPTAPPWEFVPSWLLAEADPPAFAAFQERQEEAEASDSATASLSSGTAAVASSSSSAPSPATGAGAAAGAWGGGGASAALRELVYPKAASGLYVPFVDETTDADGWIYASRASRLSKPRLGGRAGPRFGDRYRRRWWHLAESAAAPAAGRRALRKMHTLDAGQLLKDRERVQSSLYEAITLVLSRRRLSGLPLDPVAVLRRTRKEAAQYEDLCASLPAWDDAEALGPLCVAALYARAAYGHVARMGLFDSVAAGARVFSVQRASFDMAEHVDDASHARAFADMLGLRAADLVFAHWRSTGPFCPVYAIARDHAMRWLVVAVRGTLSAKDILTDCAANTVPFLEGRAHEGFVKTTERLVEVLRLVLPPEVEAYPSYRVVLCGHSMGGAVAALAAAMLRREDPWAAGCIAYGIGTPATLSRCVADRLAAERAVLTVVNARDWSPRTSLSNAYELIDDLVELGVLRTAIRGTLGHELSAALVEDEVQEQLPPGVILQIAPAADKRGPPKLLRAKGTDYRHCMPVFPDVEAHIPIFYATWLLRGLAASLGPKHRSASLQAFVWDDVEAHMGGHKKSDGTVEEFLDMFAAPRAPPASASEVPALRHSRSAGAALADGQGGDPPDPAAPPPAAGGPELAGDTRGRAASDPAGGDAADGPDSPQEPPPAPPELAPDCNAAALAALRRIATRSRSFHGDADSLLSWEDAGRKMVIECLEACL